MFGLGKKKHDLAPRYALLKVHGAQALTDGRVDYTIDVNTPRGTREGIVYTWDASDDHPLTGMLTEWRRKNPRFKPAPAGPVIVPVSDVKLEAARRIRQIIPRWKMERAVSGGKPIPPADRKAAQAVRDASNRIEKMNPLPADFTDDRYWR